ncbi:ParB/RepB/Spo0J family partition protein [Allosphingosinicella deserti]|uniref:Chromosome partitioning protein ParB n=1 Tax=Allosphingosinicella deserti TaxID=2116704 RepID=A0A2P7QW86_9SPHN|nr:ParB/RepB/Spo0J family partition protein [Sphingomonas deserti]PSJ42225.1 chromosome partitioning protein ParB [Sphingomonas deserti]
MIRTIPLNKLLASTRNVRRRGDAQADAQLKADIEARGLLQNLVVTPVAKPRGRFAVEAGERRRRALQALADEGKLDQAHGVPCLVLEVGTIPPEEASVAENFQRLSMNPADECLAFRQLIASGTDVESIARRFGLTTRFVEGRLRLADLAPVVFQALGSGEIGLEVAKAYAVTGDRERQAWVFEQIGNSYGGAQPDSVRRMMTQATASGADRRARFVGENAYVAAGGRVERDLFSGEAAARWLDVPLLERLATEKLEAIAADEASGAGLAWVRPTLAEWIGHSLASGLERIPAEPATLTDAEMERVAALQEEFDALAELVDGAEASEEARQDAEDRMAMLHKEMRALTDKPPMLPAALREQAGTFLLLDEEGRPTLHDVFYKEAADPDGGGEAGETRVDGAAIPCDPAAAVAETGPALSQRLLGELSMQRRDILAVHIVMDPALALDLATFLMVDGETGCVSERSGFSLRASRPADPMPDFCTADAPATMKLAGIVESLDRTWAEGDTRGTRFDAFRSLSSEARMAWLAYAVARTPEASIGTRGAGCAFHDHLSALLGIDLARWWRPTGMNFFDRVPKSVTLAALAEIGGPALSARYANTRKAELAQSCERIFAGDFIGDVEVKAAALAWVPDAMRFAAAADQQEEADVPPWEERPTTGLAGAGDAPALEALWGSAADGSEFGAASGEGDPGEEREGSGLMCGIEEAA